MPRGPLSAVVRGFGRLFGGGGTVAGLGEGQLLERFVATRDEAAFEALVARHGPMVVGVCRRLLEDPRDVEDAFQAVFLVLVRRAAAIRDGDRLGPWLYGVALKVARRARQQAARRRQREKGGDAVAAFEPAGNGHGHGPPDDLGPLLHEELGRLPAKYRDPIVLCDLEGRTHEEAARLLRWPIGTVKGRLSRARDLLRGRLARRGLAPTVAAVTLALQHDARASVPPLLLEKTIRAAMGVAAGAGASVLAGSVSAPALGLADGVISTMILGQIKTAAAVLLTTGAVATGTVVFAYQFVEQEISKKTQAPSGTTKALAQPGAGEGQRAYVKRRAAPPPAEADDEIEKARRELGRAWIGVLLDEYEQAVDSVLFNGADVRAAREKSVSILQAEREKLARTPQDIAAAAGRHLARVEELARRYREPNAQRRPQGGSLDLLIAEARLWVAEAKAGRPLTGLDPPEGGIAVNPLMGMPGMMGRGIMGGMAPPSVPRPKPARPDGPALASEVPGASGGATIPASGGPIAPTSQADDPQNKAIIAVLEKPISINFPDPMPLKDVLQFIRQATHSPEFPSGLPIYVDPSPYDGPDNNAVRALEQPVTMDLDGVRLKTTLRLLLKQAGLGYIVKDGVVLIGFTDSGSFKNELSLDSPSEGGVPGYGAMPSAATLQPPDFVTPAGPGIPGGAMPSAATLQAPPE